MIRKARNKENDDDECLYGMRKITYWEKYGLKRFPYPGTRRYTPLIYQSFDGGMIISNDVFGLTISQFEREFRACLERRKKQEQCILNLRYPNKSSNEYLEYLQDCTDQGKYYLLGPGNDFEEINLYKQLINTVGTEIDIRNRQRLCIIHDMIYNATSDNHTRISSGSLAEGLDLPGSDRDVMYVINNVDVIQNTRNIKQPLQRPTLVMETDTDYPGFTRLKLIAGEVDESLLIPSVSFGDTSKCFYLSADSFLNSIQQLYLNMPLSLHGPCISDQEETLDIAFCLRSTVLPYNANPWAWRYRKQWPPNFVIDRITNYGCLLVPIGPKTTALFWVSEEEDIEIFQLSKLFYCFSLCLDKLISWINKCSCPNYFIPEHNMFLGKINQSNNTKLLSVLDSIKCGGTNGLLKNLFPPYNNLYLSLGKHGKQPLGKLDILFYRVFYLPYSPVRDLSHYHKELELIEYLLKSESSKFIIDVCKYHYSKISQHVAQLLPLPITMNKTYKIHNCYHRYLQDGIKTDAVSGWLLYASFYYVTGQYNVTLRLVHYVLSRCTPNMLLLGSNIYTDDCLNIYRQNVHSTMTLNNRMKIATLDCVMYLKDSSLIPEELKLAVGDFVIFILPNVMSYFLRFLCYHHLGDIPNRRQAIRDLKLIVEDKEFMIYSPLSNFGILGICYELSGDKNKASQCYDEAFDFERS
ncbi:unnamed protein product [Mytilus coruscus]|uniref:Mab-21-like HhH/H2TH-like domain-containing protein n=1 Tax=Mytilus coruscus TaxID=42192 RepID=A0A6J8E778_MYTCO|nr:unnamed protein product [Mytilus coruscus]